MFVRESRLTALQVPPGRPRQASGIALGAALAVTSMAGLALGQAPSPPAGSPSGPAPTGPAPTAAAPGGYPPSSPAPAPASQVGSGPGAQPAGYAQPAPTPPGSAGQPGYPPSSSAPPPSSPPSGYPAQPGYPPNYAPQGQPQTAQQPTYGQPPGYGTYTEPPLPPPPKRVELQWSIRFQFLDLLFGRVKGEVEYAFAGPFSFVLLPEYVFDYAGREKADGVTVSGGGLAGEFGFWVEGRPLRGYFLKAHGGYRSVKFKSDIDETNVPATELGAMFGSQSIYGGWFTLSGGIGVVYDFQSEERSFLAIRQGVGPVRYIIPASGLFGNGADLLAQLAIGGSF